MHKNEIFSDIKGYKGKYQVSNYGRVKSLKRKHAIERILKIQMSNNGYCIITLRNPSRKTYSIHKLVAIAFLNHKPNGNKDVIDHIDFNRTNNHLSNLRILTQRENTNQKHLKSSSGYTGVCWNSYHKKWHAQITANGKNNHLGFFMNEFDASEAYKNELRKL